MAEAAEVAMEVVVAAGEETATSFAVKAVDVVVEADTEITAKMPTASLRRLAKSQYAAVEDSSVENAAIVVIAVVTAEMIAATTVDSVIAPEVAPAPRTRAQPCPPKRLPRLNPSNPPTRNEYDRIFEY